jgi:hypothetical protein
MRAQAPRTETPVASSSVRGSSPARVPKQVWSQGVVIDGFPVDTIIAPG